MENKKDTLATLKRQSTLVVWSLLTIYTLINGIFNVDRLVKEHYINFALCSIALLAQKIKKPDCYLMTLLLLFVGFFGRASFTPWVAYTQIGALTFSTLYLPLIIYFFAINRSEVLYWIASLFADESKKR